MKKRYLFLGLITALIAVRHYYIHYIHIDKLNRDLYAHVKKTDGAPIKLAELTDFEWDQMLLFSFMSGPTLAKIEERLGRKITMMNEIDTENINDINGGGAWAIVTANSKTGQAYYHSMGYYEIYYERSQNLQDEQKIFDKDTILYFRKDISFNILTYRVRAQ